MYLDNYFGKALKDARLDKEMTQAELADKAGYRPSYISCLERGLVQPDLQEIANLSAALKISLHDLIKVVENQIKL